MESPKPPHIGTASAALSKVLYEVADSLSKRKRELYSHLRQNAEPHHFYILSAFLFFLIFGSGLLRPEPQLFFLAISGSCLLLVIGFCWEVARLSLKALRNNLVASVLASIPSSAFIVSLALPIAKNLVNEATRIDPEHFVNSVNILAFLLSPVVVAYVVAILLFGVYILTVLIFFVKAVLNLIRHFVFGEEADRFRASFIHVARASAALILSMSIFYYVGTFDTKKSGLAKVTGFLVAMADHHRYGPCDNVSTSERYRMVGDEMISVWTRGREVPFSIRPCFKE